MLQIQISGTQVVTTAYASALGRFVSADTLVPSPSDPQQLNRYAYTLNNPVKYTDPTGHYIFEDEPIATRLRNPRTGQYDVQNTLLSPASAQRDYGVNAALRQAQTTWAGDVGTPGYIGDALELIGSVLFEPLDWLFSARDCFGGDCSGVLLGLLPFVPGSARKVFNVVDDGADLVRPIQRFKKLVADNFRENLRRLTGKASGAIKGLEAHHVLPQEFVDKFRGLGFEIHDPRFGSWVDAPSHRQWSHEYNQRWKEFLNTNPNKEGVLDFARQLSKEYGFDVHFDES
jgi:hypothetical protein